MTFSTTSLGWSHVDTVQLDTMSPFVRAINSGRQNIFERKPGLVAEKTTPEFASSIQVSNMAGENYERKKVSKYEKNVKNVPEVYGRVIVAVAASRETTRADPRFLVSRDLDAITGSVYANDLPPNRRNYVRKFITKNGELMDDFIREKKITSERTENSPFKSYEEIGNAALFFERGRAVGHAADGRQQHKTVDRARSPDFLGFSRRKQMKAQEIPSFYTQYKKN